MPLNNHPPAPPILRLAALAVLLSGVGLAVMALVAIVSAIRHGFHGEWSGLLTDIIAASVCLSLAVVFTASGLSGVRQSRTANYRHLLAMIFSTVFVLLVHLGATLLSATPLVDRVLDAKIPWAFLVPAALALVCSALYYAACHYLRRWERLSEAQRAPFLAPPSRRWFKCLAYLVASSIFAFFDPYLSNPEQFPLTMLLALTASLVAAISFYKIAWRLAETRLSGQDEVFSKSSSEFKVNP